MIKCTVTDYIDAQSIILGAHPIYQFETRGQQSMLAMRPDTRRSVNVEAALMDILLVNTNEPDNIILRGTIPSRVRDIMKRLADLKKHTEPEFLGAEIENALQLKRDQEDFYPKSDLFPSVFPDTTPEEDFISVADDQLSYLDDFLENGGKILNEENDSDVNFLNAIRQLEERHRLALGDLGPKNIELTRPFVDMRGRRIEYQQRLEREFSYAGAYLEPRLMGGPDDPPTAFLPLVRISQQNELGFEIKRAMGTDKNLARVIQRDFPRITNFIQSYEGRVENMCGETERLERQLSQIKFADAAGRALREHEHFALSEDCPYLLVEEAYLQRLRQNLTEYPYVLHAPQPSGRRLHTSRIARPAAVA